MQAVIFDMDGVIVDSERQWQLAEGPFFSGLVSGWTPERHHEIVGMGVVDLYHWLVKEYRLKESEESFLGRCHELAQDIYGRRAARSSGLEELIANLKKEGIKIGLASSSPRNWIDLVLARYKMAEDFAVVASGDDAPGKTKPAPDLYLLAATGLGTAPENCVAIEDSVLGVTAAKRAGMRCVGFRNGHNDEQDLSQADAEIRGFEKLDARSLGKILSVRFS